MEQLRNPLIEWFYKIIDFAIARKRKLIIGAAILVSALVFSIGYVYYKNKLQERAHKSFVRALKIYDAKIGAKSENMLDVDFKSFSTPEEKWTAVTNVFKEGFENYKSAGIAPFFLVYESEALLNLGKVDESIEVLRQALNLMGKKNAAYSYFNIKLALMLIDTKKQELEKEGIEVLKEIAHDSKNSANDLALYRLGEYFWFAKNYDEAKNYWNQLNVAYGKKSAHPSAWAAQAQIRLKLIQSKV